MNVSFSPAVDLPLVFVTVAAFVANFYLWTKSEHDDLEVELQSRLPKAIVRLFLLFGTVTVLFWLVDVAVWILYACLFLIALIASIMSANQMVIDLMVVVFGGMIREWCFGFPQLVLRPPTSKTELPHGKDDSFIGSLGTVITPLRPAGTVLIDGEKLPATSAGGTMIDNGTEIVVTEIKNGHFYVRPL